MPRAKNAPTQVNEKGVLPLKLKLIYALPRYTIRASFIVIGTYANLYYLSLGAEIQYMAFYIAVGRSLDVVTDPLMGWLSDRTRTKWGRRKPFFLPGFILYNTCYLMFWVPPEGLDTKAINHWFGVTYMLFFFADTFTSVPYYALGAELTDSYEERNSVYFWQNGAGQLGTLIGMLVPAVITVTTQNERLGYIVMAVMFVIVHSGGMCGIMAYVKERPQIDSVVAPFVVTFRRVLKNPAFVPLLFSWLLDWSVLGILSAMMPLWIQYVLINPTGNDPAENDLAVKYLGYCAGALFVSVLLSMPFWLWLGKKIGKQKAWLAYNLANSVSCPWFFFVQEGDVASAVAVAALNGFAAGGQFFVDSVTADVVDYDEFLHGSRLEGAFSTVTTMVPKLVLVATTAMPLAFVAAAGFVKSEESLDGCEKTNTATCPKAPQPQPDAVIMVIQVLFCCCPVVLTLISCLIKTYFPIKSSALMSRIQEGICIHQEGRAAFDPISRRVVGAVTIFSDSEGELQKHSWLLGHFDNDVIEHYRKSRSPKKAKSQMQLKLAFGTSLFFVALSVTVASSSALDDQKNSWMPTLGCVVAGGSLTYLTYAFMRLRAVLELASSGMCESEKGQALMEAHLSRFGPKEERMQTLDDRDLERKNSRGTNRVFPGTEVEPGHQAN